MKFTMSMPGCGVFGLLLLAAAFAGAQETPPPAPGPAIHADAAALQKLIGSPARLAWVRDDAKLATLRTDDPRGEKEHVFRNLHDLNRPVITPSGRQIVFIVFSEWASYVVNWDGTDLKKLVEGRATHVRQDERGTEWVYWQTRDNEIRTGPLKEPGAGELVWKFSVPPRPNKTENFQTSADGLRAAANFPWPQLGMAKLPRRQDADFVKFATGCWPQLARDNSYRLLFCTDGIHDRLALFDGAGTRGRIIPINPGPYPKRHGAECHRWANDPRFLVCSDRPNEEGQTNIYLGRFSDDFTFLGDWRIVTEKGRNVEPDLWVSAAAAYPGPAARDLEPVGLNAAAEENRWPGSHAGLEFLWENLASDNQIFTPEGKPLRRCNATPRRQARPAHAQALDLHGGLLRAEDGANELLESCRASGQFTIQALLTPADAPQDGAMVVFAASKDDANFILAQAGDRVALTIRLQSAGVAHQQTVDLGKLPAGKTSHLAVTFGSGKAVSYLNGKPLASGEAAGDLSAWQTQPLLCGDFERGGRNWSGVLEGLALHSRALTAEEVARDAELYLGRLIRRGYVQRAAVFARLLEVTPVPKFDTAEYPRCLATCAYRVTRGQDLRSNSLKGKTIRVAHWVLLDRKPVRFDKQVGQTYPLSLVKADSWTGLEMERRVEQVQEQAAPLYVEVGH